MTYLIIAVCGLLISHIALTVQVWRLQQLVDHIRLVVQP